MKTESCCSNATGPIAVCVPSTKKEKMEAIVALSHAVEELAKALNSTHLVANIQNCSIDQRGNTADGTAGIFIGGVE